MFKRIALFIVTNILVITTISIVINLLGIKPYLSQNGIDYGALMVFCLIWGMAGSLISLAMSRMTAKWMMGVQVIDPKQPGQFSWLVEMVTNLSRSAKLPVVPEIGVYDSPDVNGFATGPSQRRSIVALSTGLINRMSQDEIAGVVAHELAHIKNGDMVTMTLLQGVVNAFVMFLARVIGFFVSQSVKEESRAMVQMIVVLALDILLGILGSMVVFAFSRYREFKADAGSAKIGGREKMIAALEALKRMHGIGEDQEEHASLATMKISGKRTGFLSLFATHPSLDERIERLKNFA